MFRVNIIVVAIVAVAILGFFYGIVNKRKKTQRRLKAYNDEHLWV